MILIFIGVLIFAGCSNEKGVADMQKEKEDETSLNIDKEILEDSKEVAGNLQYAMDQFVQYGTELSDEEYERQIGFLLDEDHYFGLSMNEDKYTKEEYELLELTVSASRNHLEYMKSDFIGDEVVKEQVLKSFNRTMDTINATLNKAK
jgi:hypothetical protein